VIKVGDNVSVQIHFNDFRDIAYRREAVDQHGSLYKLSCKTQDADEITLLENRFRVFKTNLLPDYGTIG
jgi:hypothetical protein